MPILAREPDVFPEDLLDIVGLDEENGLCWQALYCRSRQEKTLMRRLRTLDVPFYSPLIARRTRSPSGRTRTSYVPLFSSYVFIYGDQNHRYLAQTTGCVSRYLEVPDPVQLTHDLRQIQQLALSGSPLTLEARLQPGSRVRVCSGRFVGLEGVLVRRVNKARLIVAVNYLQQGASVLLDDYQVESLD